MPIFAPPTYSHTYKYFMGHNSVSTNTPGDTIVMLSGKLADVGFVNPGHHRVFASVARDAGLGAEPRGWVFAVCSGIA